MFICFRFVLVLYLYLVFRYVFLFFFLFFAFLLCLCCVRFFFFFKHKTAYELRISDWSSDVCSSDLSVYIVRCPAASLVRTTRTGAPPHDPYHRSSGWQRRAQAGRTLGAPVDGVPAERLHRARRCRHRHGPRDRKSVVEGKSVSVRVDLGGLRIIKNTKNCLFT